MNRKKLKLGDVTEGWEMSIKNIDQKTQEQLEAESFEIWQDAFPYWWSSPRDWEELDDEDSVDEDMRQQ